MKPGDTVKYLGTHAVLRTGQLCTVREVGPTHIQVTSDTGFVGTDVNDFILVAIS